MLRHALALLLALAVGLAPALCNAELYRWVDELGVTHYATDLDSIPSSARDDALEILATPAPVAAPRAQPVPAEPAPAPTPPSAPEAASPAIATPEIATPAITSPTLALPESALPEPVTPESAPSAALPAATPATETTTPLPTAPPVFPGPPATAPIPPEDPRAAEVAELEAQIASDRERLRQMISTKRWDSAELASDPGVREIAERLPRLQAQLAALRAETVP